MLSILVPSQTHWETQKVNCYRQSFVIPGAADLSYNHLQWSQDDGQNCGQLWMEVVVGEIMTRTSFSPYAHAKMLEFWLSYFPVQNRKNK